jgi:hypothetical protein
MIRQVEERKAAVLARKPALLMVAVCAIFMSASAQTGIARQTVHQSQISTGVLLKLRTTLLRFAKTNGDPHPKQVQAVRTRLAAAEYLLDPTVPDGQGSVAAYLACARGSFVTPTHSVPPGYHPHGPPPTALCVVVIARGLGLTEFSLGPRYPDLRRLGTVHNLALVRSTRASA